MYWEQYPSADNAKEMSPGTIASLDPSHADVPSIRPYPLHMRFLMREELLHVIGSGITKDSIRALTDASPRDFGSKAYDQSHSGLLSSSRSFAKFFQSVRAAP